MKLNSGDLLGYNSDVRSLEELLRCLGNRVKEKMCVLVRITQRDRPVREKVFRESANITGGLVNPKSEGWQTSWRLRYEPQQRPQGSVLALGGISLCHVAYLVRPTHIMEGDLLYLQSTDLSVNHISNIPDNNI